MAHLLATQVVGGEVAAGRGLDRGLKRKRTMPIRLSPALTSALLAMVALALSEPSALAADTLIPLGDHWDRAHKSRS